jgi:TonB family protein
VDKKEIIIILLVGVIAFIAYSSNRKMELLEARLDGVLSASSYQPGRIPKGGRREVDPYTAKAVKNTIRKRAGKLQELYVAYLARNPEEKSDGKVEIDWQIDRDGNTISPEIIFSEFGNAELEKGMLKAISGWKFPPPPSGRTRYISHKFTFKKE